MVSENSFTNIFFEFVFNVDCFSIQIEPISKTMESKEKNFSI